MKRPTALYRLFDDSDQLLYVGIAYDPKQRWYSHAGTSPWWPLVARKTVEWHEHRLAAEDAERSAIQAEEPRFNRAWSVNPPAERPAGSAPKKKAMDPALRQKLVVAAETYRQAPLVLRDEILAASDKGDSVAEITRAIGHAYTADYVARLIREHRKAKKGNS